MALNTRIRQFMREYPEHDDDPLDLMLLFSQAVQSPTVDPILLERFYKFGLNKLPTNPRPHTYFYQRGWNEFQAAQERFRQMFSEPPTPPMPPPSPAPVDPAAGRLRELHGSGRRPNPYALFVKKHYNKKQSFPENAKRISELWKKSKLPKKE